MRNDEREVLNLINDTTALISKEQVNNIGCVINSANQAKALADNVEFWKWFTESYPKFSDLGVLQQAARNGTNNIERFIQGKGYEWDFILWQRSMLKNFTAQYIADTNAVQPGYDILRINLLTGEKTYLQNKAYTSNNPLHLENAKPGSIIVTNSEKVNSAKLQDFETIEFQNNEIIKSRTNSRLEQAANGEAVPAYTIRNVGASMAKAGLVGAAIGITTEAIASYRLWKSGSISDIEYLKEVVNAGCECGLTSAGTAGIMIPVTAALTAAGLPAAPITIPIAILIGAGISKIISPIFKRGDYKKILNEARYYDNIINISSDFTNSLEYAAEQFNAFVYDCTLQTMKFEINQFEFKTIEQMHEKANLMISQKKERIDCLSNDIENFINNI